LSVGRPAGYVARPLIVLSGWLSAFRTDYSNIIPTGET
jgi:hypothetical protein